MSGVRALRYASSSNARGELLPGSVGTGFSEQQVCHFFVPEGAAALFVDDAELERCEFEGAPAWRWQPGFFAGRVMAELVDHHGIAIAEYRLDVSPDEGKLGGETFASMIEEIRAFDPRLLAGSEIAQASFGTSGHAASPWLAYARLRRHSDELMRALSAIAAQPLTRLRSERSLTSYQRVRRLDLKGVRSVLRHGEVAASIRGTLPILGGVSRLVNVAISVEDVDNPANRAIAALILAARRRCRSLSAWLHEMEQHEETDGARTPVRPRLGRKLAFLKSLEGRLDALLLRHPFNVVRRIEVSAAALNVISAHPAYARAYRTGWYALKSGLSGDLSDEILWISPTWEIYERWCFTLVVAELRKLYPDMTWRSLVTGALPDRICVVGEDSRTSIRVYLQRTFRAGDLPGGAFRSVSAERKPDLVVTMERGANRRMIVMDAKYRSSRRNLLKAMHSAHAYQDCLRWDGSRPACTVLLVPRSEQANWLATEAFVRENKVGIVPTSVPDSVRKLLASFLA